MIEAQILTSKWANALSAALLAVALALSFASTSADVAQGADADGAARVHYNAVANAPDEIAAAMPEGRPELSTREVSLALWNARRGGQLDLSGRSLRYLDLAGLVLGGARLSDSDLWGVDFTDSDLSNANLSRARLNRSSLTRANLTGSDLAGATILRPTIHTSMQFEWKDAPRFDSANLADARLMGKFDGASFKAANLKGADFSSYEPRAGQGTLTTRRGTDLIGCDFSGANLAGANLTAAILEFARFTDADLRGARLVDAALSKVDFSGADLAGADFTGADVYNAVFTGAKGIETAIGLKTARNADKVVWSAADPNTDGVR